MRARQTQWGPIFGLLLVAPFVGEFLLGNLTVAELPIGVLLAPMYGFGALLVREVGRRTGGWPTMVLLAAAYALFEEGPVDQLLWNDSYAGQDLLHGPTYLPSIGMSVALVQQVLSLHTIWSICVPIALVEALAGARRNVVWVGRCGLGVIGLLFALGAVLVFAPSSAVCSWCGPRCARDERCSLRGRRWSDRRHLVVSVATPKQTCFRSPPRCGRHLVCRPVR
ncbi:hypothetical protein [Nocardia brasiliensis]|uniref:Uncharacterized protein n=1 Tax=Nocardia brasiliensis (strain ATCC 700358 / HUJEG-1) TaxID=1133849 RepID=K0F0Y3_NOCB7|nr:hypothetical protein [Nocardia brasiliensis]AFU01336.1 hypothetical protein O3I_016875 [Nocardia brasiliensis ATCC 700358]